jgi:phage terminase large subunit-like protein
MSSIKFCDKVLEGVIAKESLFIYIAEMNKDDDMWLPENWAKANPLNLWSDDLNMDQEKIKRMAEKALEAKEKGDTELLNFMTKSLNIWVTYSAGSLLDIAKWKQCESDLTLEDMKGRECYLGIDLSQGGDLTSIGLVFPLDDQKVYVYSHSFMPELRLLEHEKNRRSPLSGLGKSRLFNSHVRSFWTENRL